MTRNKISAILCLVCIVVSGTGWLAAGSFENLEPGVSTKSDADRLLGAPIREVARGWRFDYDPRPYSANRITIEINRESGHISKIDLYPKEQFSVSDYRQWFDLSQPLRSEIDALGNRVEYYPEAGISLHLSGPSENAPVRFFRHYDMSEILTPENRVQTPPRKQVQRRPDTGVPPGYSTPRRVASLEEYVKRAEQAKKDQDWPALKRLVEEGLGRYPKSDELWGLRANYYYFSSSAEPNPERQNEILYSARKAYNLNSDMGNTVDLGWVYYDVFRDCGAALNFFRKVEEEFGAENPHIFKYMGLCYENIGDNREALDSYRRYLRAAPNDPELPEIRNRIQRLSE